jgi:hypothetical protein
MVFGPAAVLRHPPAEVQLVVMLAIAVIPPVRDFLGYLGLPLLPIFGLPTRLINRGGIWYLLFAPVLCPGREGQKGLRF